MFQMQMKPKLSVLNSRVFLLFVSNDVITPWLTFVWNTQRLVIIIIIIIIIIIVIIIIIRPL